MECTHLWDALGICQWCKINVRVVVARLTAENTGLKEYSESRDESIKVYREEIDVWREKKKMLENDLAKAWDENAKLKERLKGMCTIEVHPDSKLAKESQEGM